MKSLHFFATSVNCFRGRYGHELAQNMFKINDLKESAFPSSVNTVVTHELLSYQELTNDSV